jgi:hypothetical protein
MHRDFSEYISTDEDRLTFRKWLVGLGAFYGLSILLIVSLVAVRSHQTIMPHNVAVVAPAATTIAINNNRAH